MMSPDPENEPNLKATPLTKKGRVGNERGERKIMDLAIAGAVAVSVVLWILSGVAQYKHRDTAVIWTVYFAIVLTILVFFLTWQKREWKKLGLDNVNATAKNELPLAVKASGVFDDQTSSKCTEIEIRLKLLRRSRRR